MAKETLNNAIDNALDSQIESESAAAPETTTETVETAAPETPEGEEVTPEQPAQAQADDDDDDSLSVSAEELAQIKANPALAKLYKSMNKNYTQKSMSLAQERQLIDALRNPDTRQDAVRVIATMAGYELAERRKEEPKTTASEVVDQTITELNSVFTPEISAALKPVLENIARNTAKSVLEKEVGPLQEATTYLTADANRRQSEAEVKAFKSKYPNQITPEIESKMAALFNELPPSENVDAGKYLDYLYKIVRADVSKTAVTKEVTNRMTQAAARQEPKGNTQTARIKPTGEKRSMDFNARFDEAFGEAREGR